MPLDFTEIQFLAQLFDADHHFHSMSNFTTSKFTFTFTSHAGPLFVFGFQLASVVHDHLSISRRFIYNQELPQIDF